MRRNQELLDRRKRIVRNYVAKSKHTGIAVWKLSQRFCVSEATIWKDLKD